jgi:hypothetical protein
MEIRKYDNKIVIVDILEGWLRNYAYIYKFEKKDGKIIGTAEFPYKSGYKTTTLSKDDMIRILESFLKDAKNEEELKIIKNLLEEVSAS